MTVQAVETLTPYSTAVPLMGALPTWMTPYDAERVMSYQIYEQIYWSVPETFRLDQRGSDSNPIYIPAGKTIVDTTNRFVGKDFGFSLDPEVGSDSDRTVLGNAFLNLFRREQFWSKFSANKRFGLIRGDWLFHLLANPAKPEGSRITIETVDPGAYFPQYHPDDPERLIAVHIVEQIMDGEKVMIKRQTYTKGADPLENDGSDRTIYNSIGLFDPKAWEDVSLNPVTKIKEAEPLPAPIASIPIYHIKNFWTPGDPFGSSELRGLERVISAVNQAISDEELALALDGLGMYATDGGPPKDENGQITDWILGPGSVVEHTPKSKFERVSGVTNVAPVLDHARFLISQMRESSGTPDVAVGKVDVSVAESGIALTLQMGPMLAKVSEKEQIITDEMRHMYYDLATGWLPAYEGITSAARAEPSYGNTLPDDKAAQVKEVMELVAAGFADAEWGRAEVARIRGYDFGNAMAARVASERAQIAAAYDPFAARMAAEADVPEGGQGA